MLCRSKRRGFHHYVQGQVKEISKNFAIEIKKLEIELKKQEVGRSAKIYVNVYLITFCGPYMPTGNNPT